MSWPLLVSIIVAVIAFLMMVAGDFDIDHPFFFAGMMILMADGFLGFGLASSLITVNKSPVSYYEAEEVFVGDKYLVTVLNGNALVSGEKRIIDKAKDGVVKIGVVKSINSYGVCIEGRSSIYVFTKEEWDKVNFITLEKADGGEHETKTDLTERDRH